jgi:dienelactone hydrolase
MAPVLRQDVTFAGEIAAWLYHPEGATGAVVLGHGLSAVRDQRLPAYAERFAAAGLAALVFDYRHFGASGGEPRQLLDINRQLEDWRSAFAYARGLEGITKVGLFGSSFGGGHVLSLATEEPAVAAVVAQCPMTDGLKASLMTPKLTMAKLTKVALQDQLGSYLGRRPKLIPAVGRPGELALRVGLKIGLYRPGQHAALIACPLLVCVCDHDSLVDVEASDKVAHDAPQGEVAHYPIGHFDIYTGDWFERAVSRQAEFLARHLS